MEVPQQPRVVHQIPVGSVLQLAERVHRCVPFEFFHLVHTFGTCPEDRVDQLLEVAVGNVLVRVAVADHLTLFGDLDASLDRLDRLRKDRPVGGAATSAQRAATPVEKQQLHAVCVADVRQLALRPKEHPVGHEIAAVFVRVTVADHHLLPVASFSQMAPISVDLEELRHDHRRGAKVCHRLKQGRDIDLAKQAGITCQKSDLQHVADLGRHANDVSLYGGLAKCALSSPDETARDRETVRLYQGVRSGSLAGCRSPFGAFDMVGNVEEWVVTSRPQWPYRSSLKGGYWTKPWAGCRGTNERHGPQFRFYQMGFRCCAEPAPPEG